MRLATIVCAALCWLTLVTRSKTEAQQQPPVLQPTTVQLPTFRVFTVQTTVSVPDSGGASLASLKRARDGRITRGAGPLRSGALASGRDAGGVSVHATVIDHHAIDEALHAAAARRDGTPLDPARPEAARLSRHVAAEAPASLAAIRAEKAAATASRSAAQNAEAADYLAQGQRAEAAGNAGTAKIFYQMASRRGDRQVQQQALDRLHALAADKDRTIANR
jgi:hypothetical protein